MKKKNDYFKERKEDISQPYDEWEMRPEDYERMGPLFDEEMMTT